MRTSDIPCPKDCPLRTSYCHSTCPDYDKSAKRQNQKRQERLKQSQAAYDTMRVRRDRIVPINMRKNKEKV